MQIVTWSGQGDGTFGVPFLLQKPVNFNIEAPFNIFISANYIAPQPETTYFRFSDSLTKYTLAHIISNRDSLIYVETRNAIKVTLFLTDKVDYTDGAFQVLTYNGNQYIVKQQIFDPKRAEFVGYYRGLWVSKAHYGANDAVMYDNFLYVCIEANHDTVFDKNKWINVSGIEVVSIDRDPTNEDYEYALGTMWINTTTYDHFVLVNNVVDEAIWNPNSDPIIVGTYDQLIEGTDTESKSWSPAVLKESIKELSTKVFTQSNEPTDFDTDDIWFDTSN
jgi:hypothetical protein